MKPNRKRQVTTITLDPEVVQEARELGANLSRICENALKEFIVKNKPENCPIEKGRDCQNGSPGRNFGRPVDIRIRQDFSLPPSRAPKARRILWGFNP